MWEWFIANGVWILVALIIGLMLFLALKRWGERIIRKAVPEQFHKQLEGTLQLVNRVILGIGGLLIVLGVVAVTMSSLGTDFTPALGTLGNWLLEHGVRIFIIIGIAYLVYKLVGALTPRLIERSITARGRGRRAREELRKRI